MRVEPELARIVYAGAGLLPRTWRAVERCRSEPDPRGDLAVECGAIVRAYVVLIDDLETGTGGELAARVRTLLSCQLHVMSAAAKLAFCQHGPSWPALAARFGDGRGPLAEELLQMAIDISMTGRVSVVV